MDFQRILARKRQQMESLEAQLTVLRDEVTTLDRALEIAKRETGKDTDASSRAIRETPIEGASATDSKIDPPPPSSPVIPEPSHGHFMPKSVMRTAGRLIKMIREIVRDLPEPFSTVDVRIEMKRRDPELYDQSHYSSLSGTMRRMAAAGELVQIAPGGPGKEATYRRNDSQKPRHDQADEQTILEGERDLVEPAR